jgi:penicillin-binding protein 2
MYERRLKVLIVGLLVCWAGLSLRLADIQIVHGDYYQKQAAQRMIEKRILLPFVRGEIQDRFGRVLAQDEASFDLEVYYMLLARDSLWIDKYLVRPLTVGPNALSEPQARLVVDQRIERFFVELAELTDREPDELHQRSDEIIQWVDGMKRLIQRASQGRVDVIREQRMRHPLVRGLTSLQEQKVRQGIARMDWLRDSARGHEWIAVAPSTKRAIHHGESIAHFIGTLRRVVFGSPELDDSVDDDLTRYAIGDLVGHNGVEKLCEKELRGAKGLRLHNLDGDVVASLPASHGKNAKLSIDVEMQGFVYERLGEAVRNHRLACGGAAVILDVPTREILAMASYPSYDPNDRRAGRYRALEADWPGRPLEFRAAVSRYYPGSTVKPLVAALGLANGDITSNTLLTCHGRMFLQHPNTFRCYQGNVHGDITVRQAIKKSCNVFFYRLGERIEYLPLHNWFYSAGGFGRLPGSGIGREGFGRLIRRPTYRAASRHLAVGQSLVEATPLQVANMTASIAEGAWRAPTILLDDTDTRERYPLDASPAVLGLVREAMWAVANEPGGTAYEKINLRGLEIAGKTGSAETFRKKNDLEPNSVYPSPDASVVGRPSHAWFICFAPYRNPKLAMSVFVEFGGTGGSTAAPVASEIIQWIQAHRPFYLPGAG